MNLNWYKKPLFYVWSSKNISGAFFFSSHTNTLITCTFFIDSWQNWIHSVSKEGDNYVNLEIISYSHNILNNNVRLCLITNKLKYAILLINIDIVYNWLIDKKFKRSDPLIVSSQNLQYSHFSIIILKHYVW